MPAEGALIQISANFSTKCQAKTSPIFAALHTPYTSRKVPQESWSQFG